MAATTLAIGVGHLVAAVTDPATSPVVAVGSVLIDAAPQAVKAFAIETFGANDKAALLGGVLVAVLAAGALIGLLASRSLWAGLLAVALFGAIGAMAALSRPGAGAGDAIPSLLGAVAGAVALGYLLPARRRVRPDGATTVSGEVRRRGESRRAFLVNGAVVALAGVAAGALGTRVGARTMAPAGALPPAVDPAPPVDEATQVRLSGITPWRTPNEAFYRVDTALVPPSVDRATWRLRVHGMVSRELTLSYDELVALPIIERDITLACVSNPVGGPYAGNARWLGVPLRDVLDEAGIEAGAEQLVSRSVDGMTIGTPVAVALDGRDSLLAVGMNGAPLPVEHGAPVRMVIPGLYGYVSATKWLTDLELTTWDAYDPYWVQRGWAREAPIRTMSRIDTPRPLARVPAGRVRVGGVAWAQHRGVTRVEVRVDDAAWRDASLAASGGIDTWRLWTWDWDATPGRHSIAVRATDATGEVQPEARRDPYPSGATGWHTVVVTVE